MPGPLADSMELIQNLILVSQSVIYWLNFYYFYVFRITKWTHQRKHQLILSKFYGQCFQDVEITWRNKRRYKYSVNASNGILNYTEFAKVSIDIEQPLMACCGSGLTACWISFAGAVCGKDVPVFIVSAWGINTSSLGTSPFASSLGTRKLHIIIIMIQTLF